VKISSQFIIHNRFPIWCFTWSLQGEADSSLCLLDDAVYCCGRIPTCRRTAASIFRVKWIALSKFKTLYM